MRHRAGNGSVMPITVAFSGSHGSGKTTACHEVLAALKKRNVNAGLVTESARSSHFLISGNKSPEMHIEVFGLHLLNEMRAQRIYSLVLCDRSVFDFVCYAKIRFPSYDNDQEHFKMRAMHAFAREYRKNYDLLFLTSRSYGNPEGDVIRSNELVDPVHFDLTLRSILREEGAPFIELPQDSAVEASLQAINKLLCRL